ncbi:MAG: penicillin acylase family protein [Myxococcales bacterium]|nr:penicillin acylase family protein [Myxococcales bacterium]
MLLRRSLLWLSLGLCALSGGCSSATPPAARDAGVDVVAVDTGPSADLPSGDAEAGAPGCSRVSGRPSGFAWPTFAGPSAAITVHRDGLGIPHVYAANDDDALYGSGYMQAVDRLFQMELLRRSAQGTLAEVLGPDKLRQDQLVRLVNLPHWARLSTDRLRTESPTLFRQVVAWTAGVNRRIAEIRSGAAPLPPGFRRTEFDFLPTAWSPDDPIAVARLVLFQNANQLEYDVLASIVTRYVPTARGIPLFQSLTDAFVLPPEDRPRTATPTPLVWPEQKPWPLPDDVGPRFERFSAQMAPFRSGGSNNWAVAGRHTFNGRPLIAGDPHQPLQNPSVLWAQHVNSADRGGTLDVIGFSFVGTPLVQLGHNRTVAWTATTTYPDMMDLFDVEFEGGAIQLSGRSYPVERCVERIAVRGRDPVDFNIDDVPGRGVLLPNDFTPVPVAGPGNRLMFTWSGMTATNEARVFDNFNRARDVDAFERAVDQMETGAFNFIVADSRDIAYRVHVTMPDRGDPRAMPPAFMARDGNDPRAAWGAEMLAVNRFPRSRNPPRGYLASANNDPFGFTQNGELSDDPWYYGVWFDPGTRGARIEAELGRLIRSGPVTVSQMQGLQLDTHNELADALLPVLQGAIARLAEDPALTSFRGDARLPTLATLLGEWDRTMSRESPGAVVYEAWQNFYARLVLADDLGIVYDPVAEAEPIYVMKLLVQTVTGRYPNAAQFVQGGREALALRALGQTADWLVTRFGDIDPVRYRWDRFHRTRFAPSFSPPGPFAAEPVSTAGSVGTVNVSQALFFERSMPREFHESRSGAVYRMVTSFDAEGRPSAVVNFARGNSGDPTSPLWANTLPDWVDGTYRTMPFSLAEVMAASRETLTIRQTP